LRSATIILLILLAVGGLVNAVSADELILHNGDILTGTLLQLEGGTLVFSTDYAGEITVQSAKVRRLTTEASMHVTMQDGTTQKGSVFYRDGEADQTASGIDIALVQTVFPKPVPPVKYSARANVGITNERGNTQTDQYRVDAEFIARTALQRFTLGGELNREKADDIQTVNNWKAYGLYDYFLSEKWFLNANAMLEHDKFADLDRRTTLGAGAGYQFFESETLNLSASVGLAYVNEDYIVAPDDEFPGAQWSIRYDQYFFDKRVQLFHSNNGYIDLEDSNKWLINTRQGLRFPLYKGLTTTLQYNYNYQNDSSSEAISEWDSKMMVLFGYQFGN
jgi:putative salt-induced outer membrane protein YdiY